MEVKLRHTDYIRITYRLQRLRHQTVVTRESSDGLTESNNRLDLIRGWADELELPSTVCTLQSR